ncbi:hypothetical protein [Streptomyces sp. NPDC056632]|uniref:hypothetical protein n=1 Tax=Streptomyces sp. NPDC056632 TaxID=3345884 RepID=UPI0036B5514E
MDEPVEYADLPEQLRSWLDEPATRAEFRLEDGLQVLREAVREAQRELREASADSADLPSP